MEHPITPPQELVQQWWDDATTGTTYQMIEYIATQAARWGADQELEACLSRHRRMHGDYAAERLLADRRPKPLSIAEQAVQELDDAVMRGDCIATTDAMPALRKALARLAELEALSDD